jgi:polyisoprenoid-binding protein YceI
MKTAAVKTKWVLDPTHSELTFRVKHMMITNVKGEFRNFLIDVEGEDISKSNIVVSVQAASVTTNNEDRDKHLKSADFFDVENHKDLTFKSTSFKKTDNDEYELKGLLTIKGISKEVSLEVEFGGVNTDPWGNEKAGYSISGKINRKDWGLNWNAALETGGVLVSDEVRISGEFQFVKQA